MEQLNKIEIIGRVGAANMNQVGDSRVARFSVATDYVYKDREGTPIIDTMWHNVTAWEGKNIPDLASVTKGTAVHVIGRMRQNRYTNQEGIEKVNNELLAQMVEVVNEPLFTQCGF